MTSVVTQQQKIIGYIHIVVETIRINESMSPIYAQISIGELSKVNSASHPSDTVFNETFLLEVPKDPSRLIVVAK
jgi:hypothetical protein